MNVSNSSNMNACSHVLFTIEKWCGPAKSPRDKCGEICTGIVRCIVY